MFRKLLAKFCTNHGNIVEEIISALESNDNEAAVHLAHTLKGVSGNIGARDLYLAAQSLEIAIKQQDGGKLHELLQVSTERVKQVISSSSMIDVSMEMEKTSDKETSDHDETFDASRLKPLFKELEASILESDTNAQNILATVRGEVTTSLVKVELDQLNHLLDQYDFDEGFEILKVVVDKLDLA